MDGSNLDRSCTISPQVVQGRPFILITTAESAGKTARTASSRRSPGGVVCHFTQGTAFGRYFEHRSRHQYKEFRYNKPGNRFLNPLIDPSCLVIINEKGESIPNYFRFVQIPPLKSNRPNLGFPFLESGVKGCILVWIWRPVFASVWVFFGIYLPQYGYLSGVDFT